MADNHRSDITATVSQLGAPALSKDDVSRSAKDLMPLVYDDLRDLAGRFMARERPNHTLQPTALLHEAFLRLVDASQVNWQGRTHFYAVGARAMRRILIDHARQRDSAKRGGDQIRITLDDQINPPNGFDLHDMMELDDVLQKLAALDERQAKVVELRFFGGLGMEEIAHLLEVSKRTVEGDWAHARAWLKRELDPMTTDG